MNKQDLIEIIEALQPLLTEANETAQLVIICYVVFQLLINLLVPMGWVYLLWYGVKKTYDYFAKEKVEKIIHKKVINEIRLNDQFICKDDEYISNALDLSFKLAKKHGTGIESEYFHKSTADWLLEAAEEKAANN